MFSSTCPKGSAGRKLAFCSCSASANASRSRCSALADPMGHSRLRRLGFLPGALPCHQPVGISRHTRFQHRLCHFEHEANRYGIEVIHGVVADPNQVAAHYFEKSGEVNLSDPDPNWFVKLWFYDHPTRPERIRFVATYDPWSQGKEPKYVK
jgi:hypothetical protein